jgi:guanylate kinase
MSLRARTRVRGTDPEVVGVEAGPGAPKRGPGRGILFVLSGPSGVGKDSVLHHLLTAEGAAPWIGGIWKCVTATTRAPRPGEVDGVDYHFWDATHFKQQVERNALLEWAEVFGHLYGTPRGWVDERLATGDDVILKIDVQGGLQAKERRPDAVMIFLLPPSREELERRLRQRLTDTEAQIARRQKDAHFELSKARLYDYLVVNDNLETAVTQVGSIIVAERCRTARQAPRWAGIGEET